MLKQAHDIRATEPDHGIWAEVPHATLDEHVRAFRGHPAVRCATDPDAYADDDTADDEQAAQACGGCPILLACREQALRQEQGAGCSFGIRGGLNAAARQGLIAQRPPGAGRTFLPQTWSRPEVMAHLREQGCTIARNTFTAKANRGVAPWPLVSSPRGCHWDVREIRAWDPHHKKINQHTP